MSKRNEDSDRNKTKRQEIIKVKSSNTKVPINTSLFLLLIFLSINFCSCYYDIEDEIYETTDCDTMNISYTVMLKPLINQNCLVCHNAQSNFGGITLEGYNDLVQFIPSGRFQGAIKRLDGFIPMPQNAPKLLDCEIEKFDKWISDGFPDN